ncbi:MAG TPA: LytTR family DNA-binding domain-containing protein [Blastocatellia bacterium]|jgi:two-component system LytT family response regulator|nr:LytTR family DNA-binding domain-containing protein [Blastocatellia bacterium]
MTALRRVRALIVDDEPLARRRVRRLLASDPDVEIVGDCSNGREAIAAIDARSADLVFLDAQMPEVDGFQVLEALNGARVPLIIFVTAYDRYAIKAFEVNALDYLVKPFDRRRFQAAVGRAKDRLRLETGGEIERRALAVLNQLEAKSHYVDRLVIKAGGRVHFVTASAVDWIEAEGKYVRLHIGKESHLLREGIGSIEARLDPKQFLRIHRSTVVNLDRIKQLDPWFNGEYRVLLRDGTLLMLSRGFKRKLTDVFGSPL